MNSWTITQLQLSPHAPQILASTDDARAIALMIPAGESFDDHQVHERAWVTVLDGEVEITTAAGESVIGGGGLLAEFAPNERHAVHARSRRRRVREWAKRYVDRSRVSTRHRLVCSADPPPHARER